MTKGERLRQKGLSSYAAVDAVEFILGGAPHSQLVDYSAYAREGYLRNVIVYRCINLIAPAAASMAWYVTVGGEDAKERDPLVMLLRKPMLRGSWQEVVQRLLSYYLLSGNGYLLRLPRGSEPTELPPGGAVPQALELEVIRPDRIRPKVAEGKLIGYVRMVGGIESTFYPLDQTYGTCNVMHMRAFHPLDDVIGASAVQPAASRIDVHNSSGELQYSTLRNGARPRGVLQNSPPANQPSTPLSEEQLSTLRRELLEKYEGPENAGRTMILPGFLKWQTTSMSMADMEFNEGERQAARAICTSYGVPPMMVGIAGDATFANYHEARLALWEDTVLPLAYNLRDTLNDWLAPAYGKTHKLAVDEDSVPALVEKRRTLAQQLEGVSFLATNEKREALGYPPVDGGDDVVVSGRPVEKSRPLQLVRKAN